MRRPPGAPRVVRPRRRRLAARQWAWVGSSARSLHDADFVPRRTAIAAFVNDPGVSLAVCSLTAAGMGINLQVASNLVLAELIDSKSGLVTRALDGAGDDEGSSSIDVQLDALVALLTDALVAEGSSRHVRALPSRSARSGVGARRRSLALMSTRVHVEVVRVTAISRWMDELSDRWSRRVLFPGSATERPGFQAVTDVSGEYVADIARPPAEVWALLSTPASHFGALDGFVTPGPGPQRWCLVTDLAGGMVGTVVDVLEREEGHRVVLRRVTDESTLVADWSVYDAGVTPAGRASLVRLTMTMSVRAHAAEPVARGLRTAARRAVTRVDSLLTGAPAPPPHKGERAPVRGCGHRSTEPVVRCEVEMQGVVPLPIDEVWRGVLDASTFTPDVAAGECPGVVPGTPVGRAGELRFVVTSLEGRRLVRFHEVVEVGPGHRLVLRHRSTSHPTESVTTVGAHPDGALVRIVCEVLAHGDPTRQAEAVRAAFLAHLARLREELVRRARAEQQMPGSGSSTDPPSDDGRGADDGIAD